MRLRTHAGCTEKDLVALCADAPGMKAHNIRPAYFAPSREYASDWANQRGSAANYFDRIAAPVFTCLLPAYISPIKDLAKVSLEVAKGRWPDVELFRSRMMRELAKEC